jgi:hypothetical protein
MSTRLPITVTVIDPKATLVAMPLSQFLELVTLAAHCASEHSEDDDPHIYRRGSREGASYFIATMIAQRYDEGVGSVEIAERLKLDEPRTLEERYALVESLVEDVQQAPEHPDDDAGAESDGSNEVPV